MKVKFPNGTVGSELQYYMGFDDEKHLYERPQIVQDMYHSGKCRLGKTADYTEEEIRQLIKEVSNAANIKEDHLGQKEWKMNQQRALENFGMKLKTLLNL